MDSLALCIQNVKNRKLTDWCLPEATREEHGKWLLMASLDSLALLGTLTHAGQDLYHPPVSPALVSPFKGNVHVCDSVLFAQPWKYNEND